MITLNKNKTILIVEDDQMLLNILTTQFRKKGGFTVLQARDGLVGLETALAEHPDMILLDIIMPVMDGFTMLKKLREDKWGKDARVVLLTNLGQPLESMKNLKDYFYDDYLVKTDFKLEEVVAKVNKLLGV